MEASAMTQFLSSISDFFMEAITWSSQILDKVSESPALTVLVLGFPIVGFSFGLLKRLISM